MESLNEKMKRPPKPRKSAYDEKNHGAGEYKVEKTGGGVTTVRAKSTKDALTKAIRKMGWAPQRSAAARKSAGHNLKVTFVKEENEIDVELTDEMVEESYVDSVVSSTFDSIFEETIEEGASMSVDALRGLEKITDLEDLRAQAVDILRKSKTQKKKMESLIADISGYSTPKRILKTMWNAYMSGEGLGTKSNYSKRMRESVEGDEEFENLSEDSVDQYIAKLKKEMSGAKREPDTAQMARMRGLINGMSKIDKNAIKKLADADIKYMSDIARQMIDR